MHRYRLVLMLLVSLMSIHLVAGSMPYVGVVLATLGIGLLVAALASLSRSRAVFWVGLALAGPTLVNLWTWDAAEMGGSAFHAPFFLFATVAVAADVLRAERVTEDTLLGSVCAYLFICLAFAGLYEATELGQPGSFSGIDDGVRLFARFSYFSLVTLTTLGYGDVTPLTSTGQSLVILESVVGILYPALVVARIVSVYTTGGGRAFALPEPGLSRDNRRIALLAALLVTSILALPWLEQRQAARLLVAGAIALVLLGCLYALTDERRLRWAATLLAAGAIAARFLHDRGVLHAAGVAFEIVFILLVIGRVGMLAFRQQRVTVGLLLAAPCLYLLLGSAFASCFELAELVVPGSLAPSGEIPRSRLLYFSFMTLTTTGFGDITPQIPLTKTLAAAESVIGIFYPAVMLARLVALYDADDEVRSS